MKEAARSIDFYMARHALLEALRRALLPACPMLVTPVGRLLLEVVATGVVDKMDESWARGYQLGKRVGAYRPLVWFTEEQLQGVE